MKGKRITTGWPFEAMAGYSRAVVDEDIIYISGTTGYDARNEMLPGECKRPGSNGIFNYRSCP